MEKRLIIVLVQLHEIYFRQYNSILLLSENKEIDVIAQIQDESKTDIEAIRNKYRLEIEQDALVIIKDLNTSHGSTRIKILELIAKLKDGGFTLEEIKDILLNEIKFCSRATIYSTLPKEFKRDYKKPEQKSSDTIVQNQTMVELNKSGSQNTVLLNKDEDTSSIQEPNPNPEPVYNQGQTIEPELDQGFMSDNEPLPEGKEYYDAEKEDLKKEIAKLREQPRQPDNRDLAIDTLQKEVDRLREIEKEIGKLKELQKEVDRLREELRQANQPKQSTDEIRYHFPLKAMLDVCDKHLREGSVKAYLIVRNGKIAGVRGVLPDRR